jgi:hypothetical protein
MNEVTLSTPDTLLEAPELAPLSILDMALAQTSYALFAAHPEIAGHDTLEACAYSSAELWVADASQADIGALQHLIARYREAVEATRSRHWQRDRPF